MNERIQMNEGRAEGEERRRNLRAVMLPEQQGPDCEVNHSNVTATLRA